MLNSGFDTLGLLNAIIGALIGISATIMLSPLWYYWMFEGRRKTVVTHSATLSWFEEWDFPLAPVVSVSDRG